MHTCVATLLDAIFTLAIFVPTLYGLDPQLAYVAVATAVGGVGVSAVVGRRLVTLEVNNQAPNNNSNNNNNNNNNNQVWSRSK